MVSVVLKKDICHSIGDKRRRQQADDAFVSIVIRAER
jgi:hypothetical protein